jgi:hypothetical protein
MESTNSVRLEYIKLIPSGLGLMVEMRDVVD